MFICQLKMFFSFSDESLTAILQNVTIHHSTVPYISFPCITIHNLRRIVRVNVPPSDSLLLKLPTPFGVMNLEKSIL